MTVYYISLYFYLYGILGWCTEVIYAAFKEKRFVNRGFLNGPICPIYGMGVVIVVYLLNIFRSDPVLLFVMSVILVTSLEWITGFIMEKLFRHKWWDYSNIPLNLNGYVCLPFSLIWGVGCVLIVDFIHPAIHGLMVHLPFVLGVVLLVFMGIVLAADIYITVVGIAKINQRLDRMEKVAAELREMAENMGENLYKGVLDALAKKEEVKQKLDVSESITTRIQELRKNYNDLAAVRTYVSSRLMKAFPKMKSKKYKEAWTELRKRFKN